MIDPVCSAHTPSLWLLKVVKQGSTKELVNPVCSAHLFGCGQLCQVHGLDVFAEYEQVRQQN